MSLASGYQCNCGERFPCSLLGAWEAKLHAEDAGHRLRAGAHFFA